MEEACSQASDEWPEVTVSRSRKQEAEGWNMLTQAVNRDDFVSKFKLTGSSRDEVLEATVTG
jgi:hypothetical protein